jgi:hypothetical protein
VVLLVAGIVPDQEKDVEAQTGLTTEIMEGQHFILRVQRAVEEFAASN